MIAVELFAGAGGAALGLSAAGIQHAACVERDPDAAATLRAAGLPAVCQDVLHWLDSAPEAAPDLLWASPPCQPYSKAGKRRGAEDERDAWPLVVRAVEVLHPRWVIVENVRGAPVEAWRQALLSAGYAWAAHRLLDAADYGVPQHRRRQFLVAGPQPIRWPEPTHCDPLDRLLLWSGRRPWVGCGEALSARVAIPATHPEGAESVAERRLRDLSDRPSVCVGVYRPGLAGNPVILQPSDTTRHSLTAEELAILQGFPAHPWQGNTSSQYRQIGNAVPPVLAEVLGRAVLAAEGPP